MDDRHTWSAADGLAFVAARSPGQLERSGSPARLSYSPPSLPAPASSWEASPPYASNGPRRTLSPGPSTSLLRSAGHSSHRDLPLTNRTSTLAQARERTMPARSSWAPTTDSRGSIVCASQQSALPPWNSSIKPGPLGIRKQAAAKPQAQPGATSVRATRSPARVPTPGFSAEGGGQAWSRPAGLGNQAAQARTAAAGVRSAGRAGAPSGREAWGSPGAPASRSQARGSSTASLPASQQRWLDRLADAASSLRLAESQLQDANKQVCYCGACAWCPTVITARACCSVVTVCQSTWAFISRLQRAPCTPCILDILPAVCCLLGGVADRSALASAGREAAA